MGSGVSGPSIPTAFQHITGCISNVAGAEDLAGAVMSIFCFPFLVALERARLSESAGIRTQQDKC